MEQGTASHTARSVAAHRLEYDRADAPYGVPAKDIPALGGVSKWPGDVTETVREPPVTQSSGLLPLQGR